MSDDKIEIALDVRFTLPDDEIERLRQGAQWPALFAAACRQLASITPIELAEVDKAIAMFYAAPGNEVGGLLHIVLDDSNLGDSSIAGCRDDAEQAGDVAAVALADLLLKLTWDERLKLAHVCPCCLPDLLENGPQP